MKTTLILVAAIVLLSSAPLPAQEPMESPMPPPESEMAPPGPPPDMEPPPGLEPGPENAPPEAVDRWLERMKARNTGDFERLHKMREEDPKGFRGVLRQRLTSERVLARLREHPKVYEFLMALPEQERDEVLRKLTPSVPFGGPGRRPEMMNPEIRELEKQALDVSRACREARDDAEKAAIRDDLRAKLGQLFDLRENERKGHIERIEHELSDLKKTLDDRQAHRDEIIARRLEQLTEGEKLGW